METELLLCPCCAWIPERICSPRCFAGVPGWRIRCDKCGLKTTWWHSPEEANAAWNTRATPGDTICIPEDGVPENLWLRVGVAQVIEMRTELALREQRIGELREALSRSELGEIWIWSTGDPEDGDNADTITCPILIQPETFREIWNERELLRKANEEVMPALVELREIFPDRALIIHNDGSWPPQAQPEVSAVISVYGKPIFEGATLCEAMQKARDFRRPSKQRG